MKPFEVIEVIWFENVSAFNEPTLALGPVRVSMKQFFYTISALALAFILLNLDLIIAIAVPALILMLAYARVYGITVEELLIDMIMFFGRKKSIEVEEEERKKEKKEEKGKVDKNKNKEEGKENESIQVPTTQMNEDDNSTTTAEVQQPQVPITTTTAIPVLATNNRNSNNNNILHYVVPFNKDFNIEITENKYIIVTGESTIHISKDTADAIIAIEIKDSTITRITVDKQYK